MRIRSFSQYHPRLAFNYLLLAEFCVAQDQHRQAIKIQELNLANDDLAIKLVYYQMGDSYCQLKQFDIRTLISCLKQMCIFRKLLADVDPLRQVNDPEEICEKFLTFQSKLYRFTNHY
ncbi:unnamed protein product [Adineta ricciae]|uniref:Uncharacterized protein n=1 Tax=Adineta ricciae TaxID=249248 RepID=A0A815JMZ0_ADIRI|nr:unnamed protein product [Adineta ricciae]CAF1382121.1 unnamed protein product [Adineta ricciae]